MVDDDHDSQSLLLGALPREAALVAGEEDRLVARLRNGGFFTRSRSRLALGAVAAVLLFVAGAVVGAQLTAARALDARLERGEVSAAELVRLIDEAGVDLPGAAEPTRDDLVRTVGVLWF